MEDGIKAVDETKMDCADGAGPLSSGAAVSEEAAGDLADGNANKVAYKSDSSANITGVSSAIPDVTKPPNGDAENAPNRELSTGKMKDEQLEAIKLLQQQKGQEESLEEFIRDDELLVDDKDTCMVEKILVQPEAPKRKQQPCAIWVSNINPETKASNLKVELTKYGKVLTARIVTNGEKYYGYALLENMESAKLCIEQLNRKIMNGFEVQISFDPPNKKKGVEHAAKRVNSRELSRHISKRRRRSASNDDPLTLKVSSSRSSVKRSRSSSRQRSRRGESREFETNRQREIELRIAIEKRKLAKEKRQLEFDKLQFLKYQKRVQEYTVNDQVKKEVRRLEELRRVKDDEMFRKRSLAQKSKRTPSPPPRSKSYKRREDKVAPPPPRLTRDDLSRRSWVNGAKQKVENSRGADYKYESTRKQDYRHNYQSDRKQKYIYPEAKRVEDKYKDKKDSSKDATCKTIRSEVFVASSSSSAAVASAPRSNFQYGGSVGISYPTAYRGYNPQPPPPVEYHPPPQHIPATHPQNNWNDRQLYHKDYASAGSRSLHVEHKYDDYDKRQPTYFNSNRKY